VAQRAVRSRCCVSHASGRIDAVRDYVRRGWAPVPVPGRSKNPGFDDWEKLRITEDDVERHFPAGKNVGLILGEASNGLTDVDLDTPEARRLAATFLPPTTLKHGRESNPDSHWWYVCDPTPDTKRFKDVNGETLCEVRGSGVQTIVPPSVHPDGELIEWSGIGEPAEIDGRILRHYVAQLAACTLLARHWPSTGSRHDASLALAGALLRHGFTTDAATVFVTAAARVAGDPEITDREHAVRDTAAALRKGDKVTGIPTLVDLFGDRVIDRFCTWLEIKPAEQGPTILFDAPALEPDERIEWRDILDNTPLSADRLPYWMERLVAHIHPYTCMFPDDWSVMLALPYWSALWPKPLLQNLHLNIWTLGLGIQGIGKNIATDELIAILAGVSGDDREDGIVLYTAGSPEGMWDALDGTGKRMFCYHDEFAGFLKLLRRDHMQSARESLCSLYDGRVVAYHRARKNSITILNPHVAVAATTTPAAIREFAEAQDLSNGYLSRFMICAPDAYQIAPAYYPSDSVARRDLVRELAAHLHRYRDISAIHWDGSGQDDPDRLLAYREHLGMNNGALIDLDRRSSDEVIPVGRLLARVKKIAALLELAERSPNVAGETAYVRSEHLETAIDIVERSYAYAVRVVNWVGLSPDYELSHRVYQLLTEQREGMTQRELCRRTHRKASEMKIALELLISDGRVASRKVGRAERWIAA